MTYDTLFDEFILCVPEDASKIKEIAESASANSSDGMHVMFGMVIVPYLVELLKNRNEEKLNSSFDFLEKMAESDNSLISEVLEFTVLEDLISRDKLILDQCKSFMRRKTLERCLIVEKYMM